MFSEGNPSSWKYSALGHRISRHWNHDGSDRNCLPLSSPLYRISTPGEKSRGTHQDELRVSAAWMGCKLVALFFHGKCSLLVGLLFGLKLQLYSDRSLCWRNTRNTAVEVNLNTIC